ncbi:hypothetical protein HK101_001482, partial [Irineochytrium annulatum]
DPDTAGLWFNQFLWKLSRHSVGEELVLYPLLESIDAKGAEMANSSRKAHQDLKELLVEVQGITDPHTLNHKMNSVMTQLMEHMKQEEDEELVYLRDHVSEAKRTEAGWKYKMSKTVGPTRPHPAVPAGTPPALKLAIEGMMTPIDKLRDMFTAFPNSQEAAKIEEKHKV